MTPAPLWIPSTGFGSRTAKKNKHNENVMLIKEAQKSYPLFCLVAINLYRICYKDRGTLTAIRIDIRCKVSAAGIHFS